MLLIDGVFMTGDDVTSARFPDVNYVRPQQLPAEHSRTEDYQAPHYDVMKSSVIMMPSPLPHSVFCSISLLLLMYTFV